MTRPSYATRRLYGQALEGFKSLAGCATSCNPCEESDTILKSAYLNWEVVSYWFVSKALFLLIAVTTWAFFARTTSGSHPFLYSIVHWDGPLYIDIARDGYWARVSNVAFYPLYPLLIRFLCLGLFMDLQWPQAAIVAISVSSVSSLFLMASLDAVCRRVVQDRARQICLALWCVMPTAVFLHVGYTEALFLTLVISGTLLIWQESWIGAGTLIGLACLTRPVGLFAYLLLLAEAMAFYRAKPRRKITAQYWVGLLLPGVAMAVHHWSQHVYFGNAFFNVMMERSVWGQHFIAPWAFPGYLIAAIRSAPEADSQAYIAFNLVYLLAAAFPTVLVMWSRNLPMSYKLYTALVVLSIICRSSEMSIPRMLMAAFPMYIALGDWCSHGSSTRRDLTLCCFLTMNVVGTVLFTAGKSFY